MKPTDETRAQSSTGEESCPICDGSGQTDEGDACANCGWTGVRRRPAKRRSNMGREMERRRFYQNEIEVLYLDSSGRLWVVVSPDLVSGPTIACRNPDAVREALSACKPFDPHATIKAKDYKGTPVDAFVCSGEQQENYETLARVCESAE